MSDKRHKCFLCNSEFEYSFNQSILLTDNIIEFGYGSKFDSLYLFPLTNWIKEKITAWGINNLPRREIPICDQCVEELISVGHIAVHEKNMEIFISDKDRFKYEFQNTRYHFFCISFDDIINDFENLKNNLFNLFEVKIENISEKDITLVYNKFTLILSPKQHLVLGIKGDTHDVYIIDQSTFKKFYYKK